MNDIDVHPGTSQHVYIYTTLLINTYVFNIIHTYIYNYIYLNKYKYICICTYDYMYIRIRLNMTQQLAFTSIFKFSHCFGKVWF